MKKLGTEMRRNNLSDSRAFTLVEVLVALAIVSIGMLVVIQAVSQTVNNSAYLRDKTLAHWVAMNRLTLIHVAQSPPTKGTSSGDDDMGGQRWHWTAEVSPTQVDSMLRVDIAVRAADGSEDSQLATITGFYGAKVAKPGTLIAQFSPAITTTFNGPAPQQPPLTPITSPTPSPSVPAPSPNVPPIQPPGTSNPSDPGGQPLIR